jgi:hypothetical protein
MNIDYPASVLLVKILASLVDRFNYYEDQLKLEMNPETARFGPMSAEEQIKLEEHNAGYKACIKDVILLTPFPFNHAFKKEFKELYDG